MDVSTFVEIYRPLIVIAFVISLINWLGYSFLAPWYKTPMGRIVWTKFLANVLILFTPFAQFLFSTVPFRYEYSLFAIVFFIITIIIVGVAIYRSQIRGYLKYKKARKEAGIYNDHVKRYLDTKLKEKEG